MEVLYALDEYTGYSLIPNVSWWIYKLQIFSIYIIYDFHPVKDTENLAIILVPLIMILSRGHTGQIKG